MKLRQREVPSTNRKQYNVRPRKSIARKNSDGQKPRKSTNKKSQKPQEAKQIVIGKNDSLLQWKWRKMEEEVIKVGEKKSLTTPKKHINSLPPELLGRVFQSGLTVVDRLHCERVSPRWKWIVGAFGWSEQRKLDRAIAFEGATNEGIKSFTHANLISLLARVAGPNLVELDLRFFKRHVPSFDLGIAGTLHMFSNLRTLNIFAYNLNDFVDFLPASLCNLQIEPLIQNWSPISVHTLRKLSVRCPNIERVPFRYTSHLSLNTVNELMGKFPRQKALNLCSLQTLPNNVTFKAIGQQKELVELSLKFCKVFDEGNERAFEAMAEGCECLRIIYLSGSNRMTERSLFHLAKAPSLTFLELYGFLPVPFTDSVLKVIAKRGLLKRLVVRSDELTDEGVIYLIDQCKSLVSLEIHHCPRITDRSLEAVVAEVQRRHGTPPRTFPTGRDDKGIFFFGCWKTKIDVNRASEMAAGNPWLKIICHAGIEDSRRQLFLQTF